MTAVDQDRKIATLLSDVRRGRVSRRELFRRGAALGISLTVLAKLSADTVLAQDATPAAVEVGSTITKPANLTADLSGQSITPILGASGAGTLFTQALCAKFTEYTGCEVNLVEGPESATDRLNISYLPLLSAESSDIDVLMIDVIWPGILARHAVDLTQVMADNGGEYFERIVTNNTVDGALVGIPWYTDAGLLYYRTDLVEKYGYAGPPATWAELEEQAAAIMEGERAAGSPDFYGFVFQGAAYEGLTCNALEWQVSQGGGNIIEPDGTVTINNPAAVAAFERAKGWVGTIAPDGVLQYKEEESRGVWQGGNSAFMRNWPYAYSLGQADDSPIKGMLDVTLLPMGEGEGAQNADTLGGWQIMVSKYSESPEAAIEFAKYLTSPEIQKSQAVERSLLPTIAAIYDDADALAANPYFSQLKGVFQGGAVPRPSTVSGEFYDDVSTEYFTAVNQIMTGDVSAADGLAGLEEALTAIMEEKAGS